MIVRRYYPKRGSRYVAERLGRSIPSVQDRALRLGIPSEVKRRWSDAEDRYLRNNYGRRSAQQIARTLGRTEQSVRGRIHALKLGTYAPEQWTDGEMEYLRKHYGKVKVAELADELGRTTDSVELKAARLGLRRKLPRLTAAQKTWAREQFGKLSYPEIATHLGISVTTVNRLASASGHNPRSHMRAWEDWEDEYLRAHYPAVTGREIARYLGRTPAMISWRVKRLGISFERRDVERMRRWTPEEDAVLRAGFRSRSCREIAEELGRTEASIAGRIASLKLRHVG